MSVLLAFELADRLHANAENRAFWKVRLGVVLVFFSDGGWLNAVFSETVAASLARALPESKAVHTVITPIVGKTATTLPHTGQKARPLSRYEVVFLRGQEEAILPTYEWLHRDRTY